MVLLEDSPGTAEWERVKRGPPLGNVASQGEPKITRARAKDDTRDQRDSGVFVREEGV